MERRGFLRAMLAAGMAPAVVRAASLMPVRALPSGLLVPGRVDILYGAGLVLGNVITIAGVANPDGMLKQFVVTGLSSGGVMTIQTTPPTGVAPLQKSACANG